MKLVRYVPNLHQEQVKLWYAQWGYEYNENIIPHTGVIVEGLCGQFLYNTDTKRCIIDGFIRNKEADGSELEEALDLVTAGIVELATELGYHVLTGETRHQAVIDRIVKHGGTVQSANYKAYHKRLI